MRAGGKAASQETIGIDIDRDAHLGWPVERAEPVADDVLDVEAARGVDQDSLAMAGSD